MDIRKLHFIRRASQTSNLHIVGHLEQPGLAIVARQEENCIAFLAELVVEHLVVQGIHLIGNSLHVVVRAEDEYIGTKESLPRFSRIDFCLPRQCDKGKQSGKDESRHIVIYLYSALKRSLMPPMEPSRLVAS